MSEPFSLLWQSILRSSLWVQESKETRLVWITMLALRDAEGIVRASIIGLADAAKVTLEECRAALKVLLSPDPMDKSKVDEGRRIREVPGGWQIVNHDRYRFSTAEKREAWKIQKANQRAAKKNALAAIPRGTPLTNESATLRAERAGASQEQLDRMANETKEAPPEYKVTEHLPDRLQEELPPYTPTPEESPGQSRLPVVTLPTSMKTTPPGLLS